MLSIVSPGADVRKGRKRGWDNADKSGQGGRGSVLADILRTSFMDGPEAQMDCNFMMKTKMKILPEGTA